MAAIMLRGGGGGGGGGELNCNGWYMDDCCLSTVNSSLDDGDHITNE